MDAASDLDESVEGRAYLVYQTANRSLSVSVTCGSALIVRNSITSATSCC